MELGYRLNNNEWIPLMWYSSKNSRDDWIKVGTLTNDNILTVRGFSVPFIHGNAQNVALKLCGSEVIEGASLSFRWLQTANSSLARDVDDIAIDDVKISITSSTLQRVLLMDTFDDQMSIK